MSKIGDFVLAKKVLREEAKMVNGIFYKDRGDGTIVVWQEGKGTCLCHTEGALTIPEAKLPRHTKDFIAKVRRIMELTKRISVLTIQLIVADDCRYELYEFRKRISRAVKETIGQGMPIPEVVIFNSTTKSLPTSMPGETWVGLAGLSR